MEKERDFAKNEGLDHAEKPLFFFLLQISTHVNDASPHGKFSNYNHSTNVQRNEILV